MSVAGIVCHVQAHSRILKLKLICGLFINYLTYLFNYMFLQILIVTQNLNICKFLLLIKTHTIELGICKLINQRDTVQLKIGFLLRYIMIVFNGVVKL